MLRQLLTLLAVMSGFALAAEPARAAPADVVSMAQAVDEADVTAVATLPQPFAQPIVAVAPAQRPLERSAPTVLVPTVELGIDRARE